MTSRPSASSPAPYSTMQSPPQKDYAAAFAALQSQYGLPSGGHLQVVVPSLPKTDTATRKWYKWGASPSSSTASLIRSTTRPDATPQLSQRAVPTQGTLTESELRLANLMAEYGHGPVSQAHFNHK